MPKYEQNMRGNNLLLHLSKSVGGKTGAVGGGGILLNLSEHHSENLFVF